MDGAFYGLNGWGIYGLNGWGILWLKWVWHLWLKWVGHLWLKWMGRLVTVFERYAQKILVFRGVPFPVLAGELFLLVVPGRMLFRNWIEVAQIVEKSSHQDMLLNYNYWHPTKKFNGRVHLVIRAYRGSCFESLATLSIKLGTWSALLQHTPNNQG